MIMSEKKSLKPKTDTRIFYFVCCKCDLGFVLTSIFSYDYMIQANIKNINIVINQNLGQNFNVVNKNF